MSALSSVRGIGARLSTPLYRNGIALALNSSLSALLGVGYWYVAAHHASQATVGRAGALVAALVALSAISQLSLPNVLVSFLPRTHRTARRLVLRAYLFASALGFGLGGMFAAIAPRLSSNFDVLRSPLAAGAFALSVAMWSVFALQDNALTGLRRAVWVPVENVLYSATKLAALVAFGAGVGVMSLFATWVIPAAIAVLPVSGVLLLRLLPSHAAREGTEDLAGLRGYFASDSAGLILAQLATTLLPVLVVVRLGARAAGAFSVAWMLVQSLDLIAINLGMSLVVEGAHDTPRLAGLLRGLRTKTLWLVGALVAIGIVAAPWILRVFGSSYAHQGAPVLRLLLLGSIGRAVNVLALCAARARRQPRRILGIQAALGLTIPTSAWILGGSIGLIGVGLAWAVAQAVIGAVTLITEPPERAMEERGTEIKTILCANHWHDDNKGDSAITSGIVSLARECWPEAEIRVATLNEAHAAYASGQLRHISAAHPVTELHSLAPTEWGSAGPLTPGTVRAAARWLVRVAGMLGEILTGRPRKHTRVQLADVDLLVLVGGSDIYDDRDVVAPMSAARLAQVLYPAWAAGRMRIPVVLAGHTLGPFPRRLARMLARRMLASARRTVLRESTSTDLARRLRLSEPTVRPDLAFATVPRHSERVRGALAAFPAPPERTLALVVRQHPHAGPAANTRIVKAFAEVTRNLLARGQLSGAVVVVQTMGPTAIEDDRALSAALVQALPDLPVTLLCEDFAPDELAAIYGSCALVLTVRLHAAILALSQGTPSFAVAYMTRKTEGVMHQVGLGDSWCQFENVDPERICAAAAELLHPATRLRL
ncbi:MAG: polysaccharide pyruvyl transferase family protein, partial [Solirubrobacterales bacterium]|nr:polysaccharide pyruvyl transferase family protein [Solirubrobacterales bacterium]